MFKNLSDRLGQVFDKLTRRGSLTEENVTEALREVRIALLEADVALPVVKEFIAKVKEKAIGQEVLKSVTPAQMVIKLVNDQLVEVLGATTADLNLAITPPAVVLMVGLQGSGKTTTTAKLAHYLSQKKKKKVLMASLDVYRPAAQEQLKVLGEQINVATLPIVLDEKPLKITKRALDMGKKEGFDVVLLDTAGRLHLDEPLMQEVKAIKEVGEPIETLLVVDAMTGQDAVNIGKSFHEALTLTGVVLTRIDGDARGGAALSMRTITHCPIKFVGVGEKVDQLEPFHPERIASRILDMGDVVSLVEQAAETINEAEAQKLNKRMEKGKFDLTDLALQLKQMQKMGGMGHLMKMLPGAGKMKEKMEGAGFDDHSIKRQIALINSMTPKERRFPKLLNANRKKRVASGSGLQVQDVNRLLKQFEGMSKMMKKVKKLGKKGLLRVGLQEMMGGKMPPGVKGSDLIQ